MKRHLIFLLLISCFFGSSTKGGSAGMTSEVHRNYKWSLKLNTLFKRGDDGYACYRIPAVVITNSGAILVFCEARKEGCSDTGNIDLVMKKSVDNGQSWSALKVIWDDKENVCGNPAPVVDVETGYIHLLTTWNNGNDHESEIIDGTSIDSREVFHLVSRDEGENWSEPENISEHVKLPDWTWYATGPVHGIQLKNDMYKGRMIIPCDHIERNSKKYYSHVIYSDDHGKSWKLGGRTQNDQVNESTVAELSNGMLLLNMRNYDRKEDQVRQMALSEDGGDSWTNQQFVQQLPEPRCQGALLAIQIDGRELLLFTNPADSRSRLNMTLSVSEDQGLTWQKKLPIYRSHAAYSDLAEMDNGNIIVLYEAGYENPYEGINFSIIPRSAF